MTASAPIRLGRFEVVRPLGRGAMGVVYLARDPLIGRLVALKTFRSDTGADDTEVHQFRARFIREAQSAGMLSQHPGIVTIHDVVHEGAGGPTFIAMEYVEGTDLKEILRSGRPLSLAFVVDVVRQIADALDYAHTHGVIHRDVKPANVIVTREGRAKITDFGIARLDSSNLTQDGQLLGTPNYMAPEQIQGGEVDHRADVFSLGVIAYELLTRQKPFQGENLTAITHRIVYDDFVPPERVVTGLPPAVGAVLRQAMAKEPAQRFDRAGALAAALAAAVAGAADSALEDTRELPPPVSAEAVDPPGSGAAASLPAPVPPAAKPRSPADETATASRTPSFGGEFPAPPSLPPPPVWKPPAAASPAPEPAPGPASAAPAAARSAGSPPRPRVGPLRLLVVAGVSAVAGLALGGIAFLLWAGPAAAPAAVTPDAGEQRTAEVSRLLRTGLRGLSSDQPEAAAEAFRAAEALAPNRPRITELRELAERIAQAKGLTAAGAAATAERLATARLALDADRPAEALGVARQVLAAEPGNVEAQEVAAAARAAIGRRRAEERAAAAPEAAPTAAARTPAAGAQAEEAAPRAPTAGPEAPATLTIEFVADLPEGNLMIAANGDRIVNEPFAFFDRVGLFKKKPYRGKITVPPRRVPAGEITFKIWVAVVGSPASFTQIGGNFPPGSERRLNIVLAPDGSVTAQLE